MSQRIPVFMTVGAIGFVLQLGALAFLTMVVGWPYEPATAIAVQLAVLHNFLWHERWTWRDRTIRTLAGPDGSSSTAAVSHSGRRYLPGAGGIARFIRYQVTTGTTSMAGNVLCTVIFVERLGMPVLAANVAAVLVMSTVNFLVSDRWVFAHRTLGIAAALAAVSASPVSAGELKAETLTAWNRYVTQTESHLTPYRASSIGTDAPQGEAIAIPGGRIHHWRGATLIRNITVDSLVHALMNPGTPPPQDDVLEARVLERSKDSLRMYLKLIRRTIMTVTYDTEHQVTFGHHRPGLATSRSVSTRIVEIGGRDRGFLWRLNSYWRYVQVGRDVRVELESVSLSRDVPTVLKPVAGPIITRIARESVTKTLDALRDFFENN